MIHIECAGFISTSLRIRRLSLTRRQKLLLLYFSFRLPALVGVTTHDTHAAHTRQERADRTTEHGIHVDVHVGTDSVIYSASGCRQNVWCWYLALGIDKNEVNAHFVAVSGIEIKPEGFTLRVKNFNLYGNDCFRVQYIESSILSHIQYPSREENQAVIRGQETHDTIMLLWLFARFAKDR